jgi:hypothetical protein
MICGIMSWDFHRVTFRRIASPDCAGRQISPAAAEAITGRGVAAGNWGDYNQGHSISANSA